MPRYTARTIARPAGDGWRLVPSVTTGGAPSFWYRRNPATDHSEWVSYDRIMRGWYVIREGRTPQDTTREPYTGGMIAMPRCDNPDPHPLGECLAYAAPRWTLDHGAITRDGVRMLTLIRARWGDDSPPAAELDALSRRIVSLLNTEDPVR